MARVALSVCKIAALTSFMIAMGGCDRLYFLTTFAALELESVSAVPAHVDLDGTCTRQCTPDSEAEINALQLSFNIVGTQLSSPGNPVIDRDVSIRPGDLIKAPDDERVYVGVPDDPDVHRSRSTRIVSEKHFNVFIECISPHPVASNEKSCSVPLNLLRTPDTLVYQANHSTGTLRPDPEDASLSLAVMVDQSGSMTGFVEPLEFKEFSPEAKTLKGENAKISVEGFTDRATDMQGFRLVAVQSLLSQLNTGDRAAVFQFGEHVSSYGAKIVRENAGQSEEINRAEADLTDRGDFADSLFQLQPEARGRSSLWMAVKDVYSFMKNSESTDVRHILVITDGPDTCAGASPDFLPHIRYFRKAKEMYELGDQSFACSDTSFQNFLQYIRDDLYDKNGRIKPVSQIPVHVSFIQMQSPGYPDPDPAQQQLACLTGGSFRFINSNGLPPSRYDIDDIDFYTWNGRHPLEVALLAAVRSFRNSMAGSWQAGVRVPDLSYLYRRLATAPKRGDGLTARSVERDMNQEGCDDPDFQFPVGIGAASGVLAGEIRPGEVNPSEALFNSSYLKSAAMQVVDMIDYRGYLHMPSHDGAADCDAWYPLCLLAGDTHKEHQDAYGNTVFEPTVNPDCLMVDFDQGIDVCRVEQLESGTPCSTGFCCWGKCIAPNENPCREDELDDVCNYPKKPDNSGCGTGLCSDGECIMPI